LDTHLRDNRYFGRSVRALPKHAERKDKAAPSVRNWLDPLVAIERYADPEFSAQRGSIRGDAESIKMEIDSLKQRYDEGVKKLAFDDGPVHDSDSVSELKKGILMPANG
jgi:hypothetical protein